MEYNLTHTLNPSFGIFSSNDSFVYVERRIGYVNDDFMKFVIEHINYLNTFKKEKGLKGYLQLRELFYNDKGGQFTCKVDYLTDSSYEVKPSIIFKNELSIIEWQLTRIELNIIETFFASDHFDKNHRKFYGIGT